MDELDIFLELYKQRANLVEELKKQLSTVSSILISIAALLFGIITHDKVPSPDKFRIACVLVLIGILGIFFTLKNKERYCYYTSRYLHHLYAIDAILRWNELHNIPIKNMRNYVRKECKLDPKKSDCLITSLVKKI